jgi:hypothetical protein
MTGFLTLKTSKLAKSDDDNLLYRCMLCVIARSAPLIFPCRARRSNLNRDSEVARFGMDEISVISRSDDDNLLYRCILCVIASQRMIRLAKSDDDNLLYRCMLCVIARSAPLIFPCRARRSNLNRDSEVARFGMDEISVIARSAAPRYYPARRDEAI